MNENNEITDAFGSLLRKGYMVAYAGKSHKDRPTINIGVVDAINSVADKVCVLRLKSSGNSLLDESSKLVWVQRTKVVALVNWPKNSEESND